MNKTKSTTKNSCCVKIPRTRMVAFLIVMFLVTSLILATLAEPYYSPPVAAKSGHKTIVDLPDIDQGAQVSAAFPLVFIENVGQFDKRVQYQVRSGYSTLFFTNDAIWLSLTEPWGKSELMADIGTSIVSGVGSKSGRQVNLRLSFAGANSHPVIEPLGRLDAQISYLLGSDSSQWYSDIPTWSGVRYVDLYPGIDLEIGSLNGQLTHRLVVREPASLQDVRLLVEGADGLALDGNYLRLTTPLGDVAYPLITVEGGAPEVAPEISLTNGFYQVSSPFALKSKSRISASLSNNDSDTLRFSTYIGGRGEDQAYDIALDNSGNVYITGQTSSTDFPTTPGALDRFYNGDLYDVFVAKLSADGSTLLYSTFIGGDSVDGAIAITVDSTGNAFVTGASWSNDFPTTPGALDRNLSGGRDVFVSKLNATGDGLIYSTFLGGDAWDYGFDIEIDDTGHAYVGGFTHGMFPVSANAAQKTFGGLGDGFVSKLSPDGSALMYSTYLGGSSWDTVLGIAIDDAGNVHLACHTQSADFPITPGVWDSTCDNCQTNVSSDGAVAKLNAEGSEFIYSTFVGGTDETGNEELRDIVIDSAGNAYLTGWTTSTDFPTTEGALQTGFGGVMDAVLLKMSADGSDLLFSTYIGGSGAERGFGIELDGEGNTYITGYTASTDFDTVDPLQEFNGGGYDAFVVKVNDDASTLLYSTYLGGSGDENCYAPPQGIADIALDSEGKIYVTGFTSSENFPITNHAYDVSFNGAPFDAFVTSLEIRPAYDNNIYLPLILKQ